MLNQLGGILGCTTHIARRRKTRLLHAISLLILRHSFMLLVSGNFQLDVDSVGNFKV